MDARTKASGHAFPSGVAMLAAVVGGAMVATQSRIGGSLAGRTGSALEAAAAVSVVGMVLVGLAAPFRRASFARLRTARTRPWWWCGGVGGASFLTAAAYGVPRVGAALATVCLVAGTTIGALLTDQFGLGPSGRHAASVWRLAGVAVVVAAVAISALGAGHRSPKPALILLLLVAGALTAVQQAANGQLRGAANDALVATFVSFTGGAILALIAVAVTGQLHVTSLPTAPWLYLGGPLGMIYIVLGATLVRALGVLRFVLGAVAGQLIASVVLDAAWPEPGTSLRIATVIGAVLTVAGVWLSGRGLAVDLTEGLAEEPAT